MSTAEVAVERAQNGRWLPGGASPNPAGPKMQLVTTALRRLAEEIELVNGTPRTRAQLMADVIYQRAMDEERKDAVLWARVFLERVDGAVRQEVEMQMGMGELMAQAHERWLVK